MTNPEFEDNSLEALVDGAVEQNAIALETVANIYERIDTVYNGADFVYRGPCPESTEILIPEGIIMVEHIDPQELGQQTSESVFSILASDIHNKYQNGKPTAAHVLFDGQDKMPLKEYPYWQPQQANKLSTRRNVGYQILASMQDYCKVSNPERDTRRRLNMWEIVGLNVLRVSPEYRDISIYPTQRP